MDQRREEQMIPAPEFVGPGPYPSGGRADKENTSPSAQAREMNHFSHFAANAYAATGVATGAATASPHQLTLMLYDAALTQMGRADASLAAGRIPEKGAAITRAIRIIEEGLLGTLDLKQGELAHNLKALYEYINTCLLKANLRNDRALLSEARSLLEGMRNTWAEIGPLAGPRVVAGRPYATARDHSGRIAA